ncbi:MAG: PEP-CTERM sorting domain-containing protein [Gemmataceae bacterium]
MMRTPLKWVASMVALSFAGQARAAFVYVGSWQLDQGPAWPTNPAVYSGQEAAALLFGGSPTDYAISIVSSDPNTVSHTAWYDGWGIHDGTLATNVFAENFHFDLGNPGYNDPGGVGSAYSAYVRDGLFGSRYTNFAFRIESTAVPEPGSLTLLGVAALSGAGYLGWRRRRPPVPA